LAEQHIEQLNEQLVRLYELLPTNSDLEAYDLEAWLLSNYGIDEDYKEFLEAYPAKPEGFTWNNDLAKEALISAQQRGFSFEVIKAKALALPRNKRAYTEWHKHPHTWLDSLQPTEPARATIEPIDSNTAQSLGELVQALSKP
jgi:hypothetical protein